MEQKRERQGPASRGGRRTRGRLPALLLALALLPGLLCGGCGSSRPDTPDTTVQAPAYPEPHAELSPELEGKTVSWTAEDIDAFQQFVDGIAVPYDFYGVPDIPDALARYDALEPVPSDSSVFLRGGTLDAEALRAQVDRNTEEFLAENGGLKYFALSDALYEAGLSAMIEGIEALIDIGYELPQLDEKLSELKLVGSQEPGVAQMAGEGGRMSVTPKTLEIKSDKNPDLDILRLTIHHETMHLGQNCTAREKQAMGFEGNLGPCYRWGTQALSPLWWNWYFESSAETLAAAQCGLQEPTAYEFGCWVLDCLTAAVIAEEDAGPLTVPALSLQSDLDRLLGLFASGSEAGRQEAVSMMYALEIMLDRPSEFFQAAQSVRQDFDQVAYVWYIRGWAAQTLTKAFYRQLSERLAQPCAVEDLFALISVFETEMRRLASLGNNADSTGGFLETYRAVQGAFFEGLAAQLDMESAALLDEFAAYHQSAVGVGISQDFLPEEDLAFLRRIEQAHATSKGAALYAG